MKYSKKQVLRAVLSALFLPVGLKAAQVDMSHLTKGVTVNDPLASLVGSVNDASSNPVSGTFYISSTQTPIQSVYRPETYYRNGQYYSGYSNDGNYYPGNYYDQIPILYPDNADQKNTLLASQLSALGVNNLDTTKTATLVAAFGNNTDASAIKTSLTDLANGTNLTIDQVIGVLQNYVNVSVDSLPGTITTDDIKVFNALAESQPSTVGNIITNYAKLNEIPTEIVNIFQKNPSAALSAMDGISNKSHTSLNQLGKGMVKSQFDDISTAATKANINLKDEKSPIALTYAELTKAANLRTVTSTSNNNDA